MSIPLYDDAVLDKLKGVFSNVVFSAPDKAFKRSAERKGLKGSADDVDVDLPLISVYRENYTVDMDRNNPRFRRRGRKIRNSDDDSRAVMAEALPVRIDYQLDVWGKRRRELDVLVGELLFWMLDNPKVSLNLGGEFEDYSPEFNWKLEDVTDNSDIMSFSDRGKYYRVTIPFYFDEAMIFRYDKLKTVMDVDIELSLEE